MMHRHCFLFAFLAVLSASTAGFAGDKPMLPPSGDPWATRPIAEDAVNRDELRVGARVYAFCASCHLADGGGRPDGAIPRLAGQPAGIVIAKLFRIRSGEVFLPVMAPFANSLSPQEVTAVASYISTLPAPAFVGHGDGKALAAGQKQYSASCAACHGAHAEGNASLQAPRLCGQHAGYVLRRVDEVVRRKRADGNAGMAAISAGVAPAELAATADYLSRGTCDPLENGAKGMKP